MSPNEPRTFGDEAFTLAEMAASLLVVGFLIAGLADVARVGARANAGVREVLAEVRGVRAAQALLTPFERAELQSMTVAINRVSAMQSEGLAIEAVQRSAGYGGVELRADTGPTARFGEPMRFELVGDERVLRIAKARDGAPVAAIATRRTAPFDCRYDIVARRCR